MAIAAVQRLAKGNQGATTSVTFGSTDGWATPTAGNLLVVSTNGDFTTTTPTGSGTWIAGPSIVDGNGVFTWYKTADGTESSVTTQLTSGTFQYVATLAEYSGVSAFDTSNSSTVSGSGGTSTSAAAVTTTVSGDLVIAFALLHSLNNPATLPSWTAGLTNVLTGQSATTWASANSTQTFVGELLGAGAAGSYSPIASWTTSAADRQQITLAFKPSVAAAPVAKQTNVRQAVRRASIF